MLSINLRGRRTVAAGSAAGLVAGLGLASVAFSSSAEAIPYYERSCSKTLLNNTPAQGWLPVSSVVVKNGTVGRHVVVDLNADAGVTPNAEIRVAYRVDAGPIQTPGAQNFANHTQYWQTRHSMVVIPVPAGDHTIRAYWRISGGAGTSGVIHGRCMTAQARTA